MILQLLHTLQQQLNGCHLMNNHTIWNFREPCTVTSNLDFKQPKQLQQITPNFTFDQSIINVRSIPCSQSCNCYLLDVQESASFTNAVIFFNATLNAPQNCDSLTVSIFNFIGGAVQNVSLTGNINISQSSNINVLNIVQNYVYTDQPGQIVDLRTDVTVNYNSAKISNVRKYKDFLTNISVVTAPAISNTTYQATKIYENNKQIQIYIPKLLVIPAEILQICQNQYNYQLRFLEDTENAQSTDFDVSFAQVLDPNVALIRVFYRIASTLVVYRENAELTYLFYRNFDITSFTLLPAAQPCSVLSFNQICMSQCPSGYFAYQKACWPHVPYEKGQYFDEASNTVKSCSTGSKAIFTDSCDSSGSCSSDLFQYDNGCVPECPIHVLQIGQTCKQPNTSSDCGFLLFHKQGDVGRLDQRWAAFYGCFKTRQSPYIYKRGELNLECDAGDFVNYADANPTCSNAKCNGQQVQTVLSLFNRCATQCDAESYSYKQKCESDCGIGYTKYNVTATCMMCSGAMTDGAFFNKVTLVCQESCDYISVEGGVSYCDQLGSPSCPRYFIDTAKNTKNCTMSCTWDYPYEDPHQQCQKTYMELLFGHGDNSNCSFPIDFSNSSYLCQIEKNLKRVELTLGKTAIMQAAEEGTIYQQVDGGIKVSGTAPIHPAAQKSPVSVFDTEMILQFAINTHSLYINVQGQLLINSKTASNTYQIEKFDSSVIGPIKYAFILGSRRLFVIADKGYYSTDFKTVKGEAKLANGASIDPDQIYNFQTSSDGAFFEYGSAKKYYYIISDYSTIFKATVPDENTFQELQLQQFTTGSKTPSMIYTMKQIGSVNFIGTDVGAFTVFNSTQKATQLSFDNVIYSDILDWATVKGGGQLLITGYAVYAKGSNDAGQLGTLQTFLANFTENSFINFADAPLTMRAAQSTVIYYKSQNIYYLRGEAGELFTVQTPLSSSGNKLFTINSGRFNSSPALLQLTWNHFPLTIETKCRGVVKKVTVQCDIDLKDITVCGPLTQQNIEAQKCQNQIVRFNIQSIDKYSNKISTGAIVDVYMLKGASKTKIRSVALPEGTGLFFSRMTYDQIHSNTAFYFEINKPDMYHNTSLTQSVTFTTTLAGNIVYTSVYDINISTIAINTNIEVNLSLIDCYSPGELSPVGVIQILIQEVELNGTTITLRTDTFVMNQTQVYNYRDVMNTEDLALRPKTLKISISDTASPRNYLDTQTSIQLSIYSSSNKLDIQLIKAVTSYSVQFQVVDERDRTNILELTQIQVKVTQSGLDVPFTYDSVQRTFSLSQTVNFDVFINGIALDINIVDLTGVFNPKSYKFQTLVDNTVYKFAIPLQTDFMNVIFYVNTTDSLQKQIPGVKVNISYVNQEGAFRESQFLQDSSGITYCNVSILKEQFNNNNVVFTVISLAPTTPYKNATVQITTTSSQLLYYPKILMLEDPLKIIVQSTVMASKIQYLSNLSYKIEIYANIDQSDKQSVSVLSNHFLNNITYLVIPVSYTDLIVNNKQLNLMITTSDPGGNFQTASDMITLNSSNFIYNSSITMKSSISQILLNLHVLDMGYAAVPGQSVKIFEYTTSIGIVPSYTIVSDANGKANIVINKSIDDFNKGFNYQFVVDGGSIYQRKVVQLSTTKSSLVYDVDIVLVQYPTIFTLYVNVQDFQSNLFISNAQVLLYNIVGSTEILLRNVTTFNSQIAITDSFANLGIQQGSTLLVTVNHADYISQQKNVIVTATSVYTLQFPLKPRYPDVTTWFVVQDENGAFLRDIEMTVYYKTLKAPAVYKTDAQGRFQHTDRAFMITNQNITVESTASMPSTYKPVSVRLDNSSLNTVVYITVPQYKQIEIKIIVTNPNGDYLNGVVAQFATASGSTIGTYVTNSLGLIVIYCNERNCGFQIGQAFAIRIDDHRYGKFVDLITLNSSTLTKTIEIGRALYTLTLIGSDKVGVQNMSVVFDDGGTITKKTTLHDGTVSIAPLTPTTLQFEIPAANGYKPVEKQQMKAENFTQIVQMELYPTYILNIQVVPTWEIPPATGNDTVTVKMQTEDLVTVGDYFTTNYSIEIVFTEASGLFMLNTQYNFIVSFPELSSDDTERLVADLVVNQADSTANIVLRLGMDRTIFTITNSDYERLSNITVQLYDNDSLAGTYVTNKLGQIHYFYNRSEVKGQLTYSIEEQSIYKPRLKRKINGNSSVTAVDVIMIQWITNSFQVKILDSQNVSVHDVTAILENRTTGIEVQREQTDLDGIAIFDSNEKTGFTYKMFKTYRLRLEDKHKRLEPREIDKFEIDSNSVFQYQLAENPWNRNKFVVIALVAILILIGVISAIVFTIYTRKLRSKVANKLQKPVAQISTPEFAALLQARWITDMRATLNKIYDKELFYTRMRMKKIRTVLERREVCFNDVPDMKTNESTISLRYITQRFDDLQSYDLDLKAVDSAISMKYVLKRFGDIESYDLTSQQSSRMITSRDSESRLQVQKSPLKPTVDKKQQGQIRQRMEQELRVLETHCRKMEKLQREVNDQDDPLQVVAQSENPVEEERWVEDVDNLIDMKTVSMQQLMQNIEDKNNLNTVFEEETHNNSNEWVQDVEEVQFDLHNSFSDRLEISQAVSEVLHQGLSDVLNDPANQPIELPVNEPEQEEWVEDVSSGPASCEKAQQLVVSSPNESQVDLFDNELKEDSDLITTV